jgi:hypothetical protein
MKWLWEMIRLPMNSTFSFLVFMVMGNDTIANEFYHFHYGTWSIVINVSRSHFRESSKTSSTIVQRSSRLRFHARKDRRPRSGQGHRFIERDMDCLD